MNSPDDEQSRELRIFQGEKVEVVFRKAKPVAESRGLHDAFAPGVTVKDGIRYERDVAVRLRDGTTIYTDVYRPDGATDVPAIVAWSPYGKRAGYAGMNFMLGVPEGTNSEMTKFEGPDPAYWCYQGYAVINPDARGAGHSEGDQSVFGSDEGRDCCDLIEWVAAQEWSNGRVGMSGDSWLAVIQWFAAAEQPPHLACIAPWEGFVDSYRSFCRPGGIVQSGFLQFITDFIGYGPGRVEDFLTMTREHPLMDAYWDDKVAALDRIRVPAYITAGWNLPLHLHGSIEGFRRIRSPQKWLVAHREFEWRYYYTPENLEDLRRFFDRYLKGIRNGWELTPPVRIDVMDAFDADDQVRRAENEFPLARTQYHELFLDAGGRRLSPTPLLAESSISYDAVDGLVTFETTFDEDTELTGYLKLRLWVEARGSDDMDLFVTVQKVDDEGNPVPTVNAIGPNPGASGMLRVSHRELDEARSTPFEPVHTHRREQLLEPGQVVPVDIGIGPTSRLWHAGERLRVVVSGHPLQAPGLGSGDPFELRNRGEHVIHTGGTFDSHLLVPVIPGGRSLNRDKGRDQAVKRFTQQQVGS